MKKTMFILVLFIAGSLNFLTAQDRLPSQRKLMYNGVDSVLFKSGDGNFIKPNGLLIGFHWTNETSISESILASQNNIYAEYMFKGTPPTPDLRLIQKNALLMVEGVITRYDSVRRKNYDVNGVFSHVLGDTGILNARHFSFKPNMLIRSIDTTQYQILAIRPYDKTRPIFGFKYIDSLALLNNTDDSNDVNYSFLSVGASSIDKTIFRDPWGIEYL